VPSKEKGRKVKKSKGKERKERNREKGGEGVGYDRRKKTGQKRVEFIPK